MIFLGNWDYTNKGHIIHEPLAGDVLRASAYKQLGIAIHKKRLRKKKQMILVDRKGTHQIKNFDTLYNHLGETYGSMVGNCAFS